jgi:N-acetylmuramic acid 6-phosphate etherase
MSAQACSDALTAADGELKVALVHLLSDVDVAHAAAALEANNGQVRKTLESLHVRAS